MFLARPWIKLFVHAGTQVKDDVRKLLPPDIQLSITETSAILNLPKG